MKTLLLPGVTERILALYQQVEREGKAADPKWSKRKWAPSVGLDYTKFCGWTNEDNPTRPELDGIVQLAQVFGVQWQWLLVGDQAKWKEVPIPEFGDKKPPGERGAGRSTPRRANAKSKRLSTRG